MTKRVLVCVVLAAVVGCKKKQEEQPAANNPPPAPEKAVEQTKPEPPPAPGPDPKLVERGAYIAKAGACVICHTAIGPTGPDLEHPFAGGLEMPDPMGTWRAPNITQDKGTGIGNWTDEQIIAAVREGVRPDGSGLYAIMPYVDYSRMTDDDAKALVAFLRTVKPVERTVAPNKDLKMPKGPGPKPTNQPDDPNDQVKHGEYMATIMLCSHCHWTPDPKTMAPAGPDKMFSGGLPITAPMLGKGTIYTANITSDPETGIGKYTEDQIYTTIKTMVKPDGKPIRGPMMFMQGTWSQLDDKDLHAVAAYIKKLPPVKHKVPASDFVPNGPPPGGAPPAGAPPAGAPPGTPAAPADQAAPKKP
jgi:mono/diheme cytochrome c family protein